MVDKLREKISGTVGLYEASSLMVPAELMRYGVNYGRSSSYLDEF